MLKWGQMCFLKEKQDDWLLWSFLPQDRSSMAFLKTCAKLLLGLFQWNSWLGRVKPCHADLCFHYQSEQPPSGLCWCRAECVQPVTTSFFSNKPVLQYPMLSTFAASNWISVVWSLGSLLCPCMVFPTSALFYCFVVVAFSRKQERRYVTAGENQIFSAS